MLNRKRIYIIIGEKLKKLRRILILQPSEMGELLGVSEDSYIKYEEGYPIPPNVLKRAIDWYNLPLREVMPTLGECSIMWVFAGDEAIQGKVNYRKAKEGVYRSVDEENEYLRTYG